MSDIISITDLKALSIEKMKTKELRDFSAAQYSLIESLKKENYVLKEKVSQLESLLQSKIDRAIPVSDEEIICIDQINILKSKSANRELSLDEVKRLDLLIKNLRLIRQQSTQVIDSVDYSNMKEADLVAALNTPNQAPE